MSKAKNNREYTGDSVDLIIPVYRPDEKLDRLIEGINGQTVRPANVFFMQTLTGDETEDEPLTRKLLGVKRATVTTLPRNRYDHGGTRNKGAELSDAPYILFMTQDAVPHDDRLIEELLAAVKRDGVSTAYARQLANDEVGAIERYIREFNYPDTGIVKSKDDIGRLGIKTYFCSNVCAIYRHDVYDEVGGFVRHTIFNEDSIMAANTVNAGYRIAYVAEASVIHAHKYTYMQQLGRNFDLAVSQRQYREIFDSVSSESEGIKLVKDTFKHLMKTGRWYLVPDLVLQSGFKYIGYFLGKRYKRLPKALVRKLSMNKSYWD